MNEFEEYRIMSDEYRQEWLSPKIPNLTEEKIVGNDHYSVNRPPVEEDTIANIIIDVLKSIPLSDISYRRIQV